MYIHHAKNISEGIPYGETGYMYNPSFPYFGPKTYPPVFPFLLVPIYWVSGLDFQAMKIIPILSLLFSLFVIYIYFRDKLPFYSVFLLIAAIGFNYYFWNFKDNILSDLPFLLFSYTFFYLADKTYSAEKSLKRVITLCLLTGISLYLSYGTRSIGIVLLPSILLYDFFHHKKFSLKGILIFLFFLIFFLTQNLLLHNEGSYFDHLYFDHKNIVNNIKFYQWHAIGFWSNGYFYPLSEWLFITISLFALGGFLFRIRKFEISEIFFLFYSAIIILWPANQGTRFLIPIFPLYLFYFFYFFEVINSISFKKKYINNAISIVLFIVISSAGLSYCMLYSKRGLPAINQGIHKIHSVNMFEVVRNKTNENDVIIFIKPRVLALMTGRKSSRYPKPKNDEELLNYINKIGASSLIVPISYYSNLRDPYLIRFIVRNNTRFKHIYSNNYFAYYKII
jgi:hypothetical protein